MNHEVLPKIRHSRVARTLALIQEYTLDRRENDLVGYCLSRKVLELLAVSDKAGEGLLAKKKRKARRVRQTPEYSPSLFPSNPYKYPKTVLSTPKPTCP